MQIVRTIVWVLILFGILAFSLFNWKPVEVALWENLVLETKIPALVIAAFLLGLVPTWLYHRSVRWSLKRRIRSLESSIKSSALSQQRHGDVTTDADDASLPVSAPATARTSVDSSADNTVDRPARTEPAGASTPRPVPPRDDPFAPTDPARKPPPDGSTT
ncbi:MAG: LapA family protein [Erythrobacter sp.]